MAYTFDRTLTHKYLRTSGTPPNWYQTPNFTVSLWFRLADVTNAHALLRLNHADDAGANNFLVSARGDLAGDPVYFISQVNGLRYTVATTTGYSANTWHHVLVRANRSDPAITVCLDGSEATITSVKFPKTTAPNYFQVSGNDAFAPAAIGSIAEVGLWDAPVGFGDSGTLQGAAQLAKGFSPRMVQPKNLINYWPLVRGLQDIRGAQTLTAYNTPTVSDHPRIIS